MEWLFWTNLGVAVFFLPLLLLLVVRFVKPRPVSHNGAIKLLVVAGSGGHTTEILRLLNSLSQKYSPRHYVLADSDKMSEEKIRCFEQKRAGKYSDSLFTLHRIPRSREVHQSWSSSVLTTVRSIFYSLPLAFRLKPDLAGNWRWGRNGWYNCRARFGSCFVRFGPGTASSCFLR
ncbi:UDP-N-acetylglucosamine transferase subunit ALG14 homolog isoform X2 [Candoia aspera]|uniref:UDP-N-acetylglucosamine transferase subunit ALG14 homolog isoform X2 n=1 Tax=Candoia aspera TaxID=51853 RepID=UPI002FD8470D